MELAPRALGGADDVESRRVTLLPSQLNQPVIHTGLAATSRRSLQSFTRCVAKIMLLPSSFGSSRLTE